MHIKQRQRPRFYLIKQRWIVEWNKQCLNNYLKQVLWRPSIIRTVDPLDWNTWLASGYTITKDKQLQNTSNAYTHTHTQINVTQNTSHIQHESNTKAKKESHQARTQAQTHQTSGYQQLSVTTLRTSAHTQHSWTKDTINKTTNTQANTRICNNKRNNARTAYHE